jgi:hypothetical protein
MNALVLLRKLSRSPSSGNCNLKAHFVATQRSWICWEGIRNVLNKIGATICLLEPLEPISLPTHTNTHTTQEKRRGEAERPRASRHNLGRKCPGLWRSGNQLMGNKPADWSTLNQARIRIGREALQPGAGPPREMLGRGQPRQRHGIWELTRGDPPGPPAPKQTHYPGCSG